MYLSDSSRIYAFRACRALIVMELIRALYVSSPVFYIREKEREKLAIYSRGGFCEDEICDDPR